MGIKTVPFPSMWPCKEYISLILTSWCGCFGMFLWLTMHYVMINCNGHVLWMHLIDLTRHLQLDCVSETKVPKFQEEALLIPRFIHIHNFLLFKMCVKSDCSRKKFVFGRVSIYWKCVNWQCTLFVVLKYASICVQKMTVLQLSGLCQYYTGIKDQQGWSYR